MAWAGRASAQYHSVSPHTSTAFALYYVNMCCCFEYFLAATHRYPFAALTASPSTSPFHVSCPRFLYVSMSVTHAYDKQQFSLRAHKKLKLNGYANSYRSNEPCSCLQLDTDI